MAGGFLSTLIAGFWGFWGRIENFHAGCYIANLRKNLALTVGRCVPPRTLVLEPKVGLTGGSESSSPSRVLTVLVVSPTAATGQPKGRPRVTGPLPRRTTEPCTATEAEG